MTTPFKVWDSLTLQENVKVALQIKATIEEICTTNNISPYELPTSEIPSAQLYDLVSAFCSMYDKLLDQSLLKTGNLRQNKANIH